MSSVQVLRAFSPEGLRRSACRVIGPALIAFVCLPAALGLAQPQPRRQLVHERTSRYYTIQVVDYPDEGRRVLLFSRARGIESSMLLADRDTLDMAYCRTMVAALALPAECKDVLLIGLGGASLPRFIQRQFPDLRLDIVELDPDVVKVAQQYFSFRGSPNTRVLVLDGRLFLKRIEKKYDVILLDAYAGDRVPFHMTTLEFVRLVKSRLAPGGVVATNLWDPAGTRFLEAEKRTYQMSFPQTYVFDAADSGNIVIFGTLDAETVAGSEWVRRAQNLAAGRRLGFDLPDLVRTEYERLTPLHIEQAPLTDDMAPVDTLRRENPRHFEEGQPPP
ncbi:MAG: fused MFS/spermidine synthase [Candidatus Brocadiia bacterium]|jgi:spermidine synthase